jgi:hypothetical protein
MGARAVGSKSRSLFSLTLACDIEENAERQPLGFMNHLVTKKLRSSSNLIFDGRCAF